MKGPGARSQNSEASSRGIQARCWATAVGHACTQHARCRSQAGTARTPHEQIAACHQSSQPPQRNHHLPKFQAVCWTL
eukprot:COSAG01_NODE_17276_length_1164_cov_1.259155_1_plen_77_part_10